MGRLNYCDLCERQMMPQFDDKGYKVTVKELKHSYDGYNPWIRKTKLDVCHRCIKRIIKSINQPSSKGKL